MSRETRRTLIAAAAAVGLTMTLAEAARLVEPTGYSELRQLVEAQPELQRAIIPGLGVAPLLMGKKAGLRVQDVFNTSLWTGTQSIQDIETDIEFAPGTLVWAKVRNEANSHYLFDSVRGSGTYLSSDTTNAALTIVNSFQFLANGYRLLTANTINRIDRDYVGWQFRRAEKFFDIVQYSGNGSSGRQVAHNLGIKPGMIIIKRINGSGNWPVYHTDLGTTQIGFLNLVDGFTVSSSWWGNIEPDETTFTINSASAINSASGEYIAYLFAHDPSPDGLIQCGSYVGNGSATGPLINLGWRPQYLLWKSTIGTENWWVQDSARGSNTRLAPNTSADESGYEGIYLDFTSTGFQPKISNGLVNGNGRTYIYMAIREAA